jgi:hypothetical protein
VSVERIRLFVALVLGSLSARSAKSCFAATISILNSTLKAAPRDSGLAKQAWEICSL